MDEATKEEVRKLLAGQPQSPRFNYAKLSLILKIGAGYAAMAVFTTVALVYSSLNLYAVNTTARGIANVDLPVISALIKLRGSLLAQESFAGKYAILGDPAFIELFRARRQETMANLAVLERPESARELADLKRLYRDYQALADQLFAGNRAKTVQQRASALRLLAALDAHYFQRQNALQAVLKRSEAQQRSTIRWTIAISCVGFLLAAWVAPRVIYRMVAALGKLQQATHRIAEGDFNYAPKLPAVQEISELASDFHQMAARLKELEQMNIDALPQTRLPGSLAIERVLEQRLQGGTPFAFCSVNLDHFKPYSAHYGYAKGSELLRVTGYLLQTAVHRHGGAKDFVGHVGGDEFVMVLATERVAEVCRAVVESFDAEAAGRFSAEELKAGGITRCGRDGAPRFSPITTISIAVLTCSPDDYATAVEIARGADDVKGALRKGAGSNWAAAS